MSYKKKYNIESASFIKPLSKLLNHQVFSIDSTFQKTGFSGSVYKLNIRNNDGKTVYVLIAKKTEDLNEYYVNKFILQPAGFPSANVYGYIEINKIQFIILDYFPHLKIEWGDIERYLKAITVLIEKDNTAESHWKLITDSQYIGKEIDNRVEGWLVTIKRGSQQKLNNQLNDNFYQILYSNIHKLRHIHEVLSKEGKLTLCHNDFQLNNILFSKKNDNVILIDWTMPNIGSTCIDLAQLVNVAPKEFRQELLGYYRKKVLFKGFDRIYSHAEVFDHLNVLSWVVKAVEEGQTNVLNYLDIDYKIERIIKFIDT